MKGFSVEPLSHDVHIGFDSFLILVYIKSSHFRLFTHFSLHLKKIQELYSYKAFRTLYKSSTFQC